MEVDDLKALQAAFDFSRGFADLPYRHGSGGTSRPDVMDRIQFSILGLIGEVGEASGLLKKAIRNSASSSGAEFSVSEFAEELADVFAYLLKIADAGDIDLSRHYLEKMALNAHRFASYDRGKQSIISVCGPPGSGKTSIVNALIKKGKFGYLERYRENPYLEDIQEPSITASFEASQRWFLQHIESYIHSCGTRISYIDQDPTAIVLVYSQLLLDRGQISRGAYLSQLQDLLRLESNYGLKLAARPVALLDAPSDILAERCAGKFGSDASPAFLEDLRSRFARVFVRLPNVHVIDARRPLREVVAAVERLAVA